ncbi:transposase IS481 family protein, partial [Chelatococcus asaccharovorans]
MSESAPPLSLDEIAGRIGGQVHGSFIIGAQVLGQGVNVRWSPQGHLNVYAEGAARYHSGDLRTATLIALGLPVAENDNDPHAPRDLPVLPRMHPAPWTPEAAGGLLGEVATWVTSTAIIPVPELSLAAALALLAGLCGDRVLAPTEAGVNVFMTTLLATAGGKGHPPRAARELGDATGKLGAVSNGDPTSYAALERILRRRPSTVIVLDEFGLVLQDINARHRSAPAASIRKFLLAIYDQANSRFDGRAYASAETKGDDSPLEGPALTVLGMTTPGTLYEGLSEASITDGFINRFVFFSAGPAAIVRPPSLERRARPPQQLVDLLKDAIDSLPRLDGLAVEAMKVVHPGPGCEAGVAKPTNPDRSARMNMHENARMTVHGRVLLVNRIVAGGWRVADAARAAGISERTAYKWLARFRAGGERMLHDRSSAPGRMPHATPVATIEAV